MTNDHENEFSRPDESKEIVPIVDERTGEIIPRNAPQPIAKAMYTFDVSAIGTLKLDENAEKVLDEPLEDADVLIRPDGLVYLPWTYYAKKLNRAFGRLQWGIIPSGNPVSKDVGYDNILVAWNFWLVVKGIPIAFSVGETTYRTTNKSMSYTDACEGAKSSALARNCKQLGISLELWDKEWIEGWKMNNAETYKKDDRVLWRKKDLNKPKAEKPVKQDAEQETSEHIEEGTVVETAQELSDGYTAKQILAKIDVVKEISTLSKKPVVEVCGFVGKLEKGKKFTVGEIVKQLGE